jgi:dTDP-glucose pyrophosphorylase
VSPDASAAEGSGRGAYQGVLLAAGKGSRMRAFSEELPKPILPVGNRPLLVHQIELLKQLGIRDIVVLIGHKGYEIARVLGDGSRYGVNITFVEQTQMLGIAHAVGQLESHVDRPFLMFLGDIFFVPRDIEAMFRTFEEQGDGAVLATKVEPDPEAIRRNFSVELADDGRVTRVIEKPRHVTNDLKGVGLYLFDLHIFDAIRRTPRTAMRDEYEITDSIQVLIDDGHTVRTANAVSDDLNLTFPEDVLKVNLRYLGGLGRDRLVDETAEVHEGAVLDNVVVGPRVRIRAPARISNAVLFEGACVDDAAPIEHAIVTRRTIVRCGEAAAPGSVLA